MSPPFFNILTNKMIASTIRFMALAALLSLVALTQNADAAASRGLAWGTDNRWAKNIAKGSIDWYHHWQAHSVPQMPNHVEYVPMLWGQRYMGLWKSQKKHFHKTKPKYVLAMNEPDVSGQSDMSPKAAVNMYMKELEPLRKKGIKVSSPQIVWNTKWMDSFMKQLHARGGDVDFMAIHYYGSYKNPKRLQKWIKTVRAKYNKNIWLTEYGVTASSGGSAKQIKNFQTKVTAWMDKLGYVDRVAWLGCFAVNNPPDAYASRQNAMLSSNGKMRSIGYSFVYSGNGKRKRDVVEHVDATNALESRATPGAKRHASQHHKRIIGLQQAADMVRRNETAAAVPDSINGFPASPEEIQEYLAALNGDDDVDEEQDTQNADEDDCDERCKLLEEETKDTELDDDDKLD